MNSKQGTLVVALLNVEGSYAENIERPTGGTSDTVQFWLGSETAWKIRTYAIDHDIHTYNLGSLEKIREAKADFAVAHIKKHYGEVLASVTVVQLLDTSDPEAAKAVLVSHGIPGCLEVAAPKCLLTRICGLRSGAQEALRAGETGRS